MDGRMDRWMDGWEDVWMDEWMDEQMDGHTDKHSVIDRQAVLTFQDHSSQQREVTVNVTINSHGVYQDSEVYLGESKASCHPLEQNFTKQILFYNFFQEKYVDTAIVKTMTEKSLEKAM